MIMMTTIIIIIEIIVKLTIYYAPQYLMSVLKVHYKIMFLRMAITVKKA